METKICTKCKKEKPLDQFYKASSFKDGKTCSCKACFFTYRQENRERQRQYMEDLRINDSEGINEKKREYWKKMDPSRRMWKQAKNRSQRKGVPFDIEVSDIVMPELCPLLEVPFMKGTRGDYEYSPSLDRIDNSKGYVKGNVQVLCSKANTMKGAATPEELVLFALNVLKMFGIVN